MILRGDKIAERDSIAACVLDRRRTGIRRAFCIHDLRERQHCRIPCQISKAHDIPRILRCLDRHANLSSLAERDFCAPHLHDERRRVDRTARERDRARCLHYGNRVDVLVIHIGLIKEDQIIASTRIFRDLKCQREECTCFGEIRRCEVIAEGKAITAVADDFRGTVVGGVVGAELHICELQRIAVPVDIDDAGAVAGIFLCGDRHLDCLTGFCLSGRAPDLKVE